MDVQKFCADFAARFPASQRNRPTRRYAWRLKVKAKAFHVQYHFFDPLRDVAGMISVKKQRLLHVAYAHLNASEAYLEIGSWQGKSLIAALRGNPARPTFACDNFSEWRRTKGQAVHPREALMNNLQRYGLAQHVTFYDESF
ncbi:MAG: hypothetical protein Q8R91_08250 [Candidatus Omnitrophota bacterium]|nr:hypothetical protein [Candidatus Omnitrophota bacterium]